MISPAEWVERYAAAWRAADPAAAASLFTPDAHYTSDPFGPGLHGRDEIAAYWAQAVSNQEGLDLRLGSPVADGNHAAAEWRASFRRDGVSVTLAACLMLRFDAEGLCDELREYWRQR